MHKRLTAILIITSIFILALKDSASFIHTILHYIPNNPWHQHAPVTHHHKINPLEIHKYLQQKHSHTHEHSEHTHTHDVMDHIHADDTEPNSSLPQINTDLKVDLFIQSDSDFLIPEITYSSFVKQYSLYNFPLITYSPFPPLRPPQLA